MGDWSLGSVATEVLVLVSNVPTSISGAPLERMADRSRRYCENYTGQTIGSTSIDIDFQGPITHLACAEVCDLMDIQGVQAGSVRLGDFTIDKGGETNLVVVAQKWKELAEKELNRIGRKMPFYRSYG